MRKNTTRAALVLFTLALIAITIDFIFIGKSKITEHSTTISQNKLALRLPIPVKLKHLNPQQVVDSVEKGLLSTVYSRLIKVDANFKVQPDALETWSYDLTKKKYYLKLRDNVYFHNGKKLTAQDVIFSFHQWAKKSSLDSNLLLTVRGVGEYHNGKSKFITGISSTNEYTIEIELEKWNDRFILDLALPKFCLFPMNFENKSADEYFAKPIGTGPYKISEPVSESVSLFRNENFYFGIPQINKIEIFYLPDQEAVHLYNTEVIDNLIFYQVAGNIHVKKFNDAVDTPIRSYKTMVLVINDSSDPELSDPNVRGNITSLINRDKLLDTCFTGSKIAKTLIPSGLAGSQEGIVTPNNAIAKTLKNRKIIYLEKTSLSPCIQTELNSQISSAGLTVKEGNFDELYKKLKAKKLSMWIELLEFKNEDPFNVLQYFWSESKEYFLGKPIPKLENLFAQVQNANTYIEKSTLYREIENYLISNKLIYPLIHPTAKVIHREWIKGLTFAGNRDYINNWHKIYIEKDSR